MNLNKLSFAIYFAIIFSNHLCYAAKGTTSAHKPITASVCADRSFGSAISSLDFGDIQMGKTATGKFTFSLEGNEKAILMMETGGAVLCHEDKAIKTELPYSLNIQADQGFTFESVAKISPSGDVGHITRYGSSSALGMIAKNMQPKLTFQVTTTVPQSGIEVGNYVASIKFTLTCI